MAFNKFDPHRPEQKKDPLDDPGERRALLLKWGWVITLVYTALGFGLMTYWALQAR